METPSTFIASSITIDWGFPITIGFVCVDTVTTDVKEPVEGYDQLVGTIKNVTEDGIELEIKIKTRVKVVNIAFSIIENAMTTVKI